jgi:myo-inositol 2-dehydrogenase/D-chiro-inositol 1-dehydrogenase
MKNDNLNRRSFLKKTASALTTVAVPTLVPSTVFGKNAPSNRIQIGQIGCGRIARVHDMPGTMQHSMAQLVAVCDVDRNRRNDAKILVDNFYQEKGGKSNIKMFDNYQELIAHKDIDAVIISTPDHWHAQPAIEAALAKKHVYLQKPTSLTVEEGRLLSTVVQNQNIILQVGTQQRSSPQFRYAAELIRNGRIGKLHTVKVGLPGDPPGPVAQVEPIPSSLNFDAWLGSTPLMDYAEMLVHPKKGYSRPGWLRKEQFGAGMITGWGQHHFDSASWGMNTEYTGPVSVEAIAEFPRYGSWDVHGDFMVKAIYQNGITMLTSGGFPNGIRYEGEDGWIFVTRGAYRATPSDPIPENNGVKSLDASDPKILNSKIGPHEIHLYESQEQHLNWLECIQSGKQPISPVEIGHRACTVCLISHIAMKLPRKLNWDPITERFVNDPEANAMLKRPQRAPYGTSSIQLKL